MGLPLKIGILSFTAVRKRASREDLMIKNSALARGHKVRIYLTKHFQFTFDTNRLSLLYKNKPFLAPDVMIVRPSILSDIDLQLSIVKQIQLMGIPVVNHYLPIARAKNKIRTVQILAHKGISVPKTVVVHSMEHVDSLVEELGSFPLIMKLAQGSFGNGVCILESMRSLRSMFDLINASDFGKNNHILIQEYVREAKGKDIRVFVVDGKIVAAMERRAKRGEFRANFHHGGSVALTDLTEEEKILSLRATKEIGLDVSGVDIIRTASGPKILEVNSNPGLEGITTATGIDVAGHIVQYAEKLVKRKKWMVEEDNFVKTA
jgi:ribosomal protein S6--L-glutamate ligase